MLSMKSSSARSRNGSELGTIIGHEAIVEGKLTVKHAVRIDGRLNGELESSDTITVGSTGRIEGTLIGENIVVGGQVEGSLKSGGLITLEAGSRLTGDLEAARLVIIDGATFSGRSAMGTTERTRVEETPHRIQLSPEPETEPAE
ncbi:hypothetical protein CEE37_14560 [candidate division LCP-89 bacterium B3_LCP]|uniref:Cell shape determination protein CcmA n=1 Tax=candidate division LCP-89 bacterium B3_LCP TaxID=2012998 RepID=A0A532UPV9_UNCL8|nr:MAG: hypothetical protein CEE37_14560 [candidate division LCP-89 bacterium B3_LCP]